MAKLELKNHQVWQDFTEILENLDAITLIKEHFEQCNYQVSGYWDEQDKYYEIISLPQSIEAELVSSSIGINNHKRFLQLKFFLTASADNALQQPNPNSQKFGELILIYDENLAFVDENWLLDINSLMVDTN
jgi:hypothetical protein